MFNFFNIFSSLLISIRYRNKKDPFLSFKNIIGISSNTLSLKEPKKGIILVTPIRVSPISNLFEALMSKFFMLKGYDVKVLMCNQSVSYCENIQKTSNKKMTCALCRKEQKRMSKYFNLESINANDYITKEEVDKIITIVSKRDFIDKKDFFFNDINFYDSIVSAVMRYTLKSEIEENISLIKEFAYTTFFFSQVLSNIFKTYNINKVVTSHGIYSTWGSVVETCLKYKIPSVVWGRGYIGQGNLLFGMNSNYEKEFIEEGISVFNDIELNNDKVEAVINYFKKKIDPASKVDYINYYQNIDKDDSQVREINKKIADYKIKFGLFTNIPWDGDVFKRTSNFPSARFFIRNVINWFIENTDCLLIIRAHPAEVSREEGRGTETFEELLQKEFDELPSNVIFIKPNSSITSYYVASIADAVILFGSTMSLELAIQRKIIIQAGKNNVSFKNIVFDAVTVTDLYNYLDAVKMKTIIITDEMYNNALKYGYYWIYQRHIVDTSVVLDKLQFIDYSFSNLDEFLSNKTLNFIYNKIIANQKIVNDEIYTD